MSLCLAWAKHPLHHYSVQSLECCPGVAVYKKNQCETLSVWDRNGSSTEIWHQLGLVSTTEPRNSYTRLLILLVTLTLPIQPPPLQKKKKSPNKTHNKNKKKSKIPFMLFQVYISTRISIRCVKYLKLRQKACISPPETKRRFTGNPASGSAESWAGAGNHSLG